MSPTVRCLRQTSAQGEQTAKHASRVRSKWQWAAEFRRSGARIRVIARVGKEAGQQGANRFVVVSDQDTEGLEGFLPGVCRLASWAALTGAKVEELLQHERVEGLQQMHIAARPQATLHIFG